MKNTKSPLTKIRIKAILSLPAALIIIWAFLFLPAWSLDYWEGWLYSAVIMIPAVFTVIYFLKKDPEFLERRMKWKEREHEQSIIITISTTLFAIGFVLPGFDHRFGWSDVPVAGVIIANIIVLLSYAMIVLVFKENSYASRIIEVEKNQKVISTGPYAVVRHPMYFGTIIMFLATPIALGSFWAIIPFLPLPALLVFRILNEEKVLRRDLNGYKEYCQKVRWRLIPYIW
ncbi:MAG: isoprenylcysteine carboxylmethyltransferase family protein [Candidatus Peregrinibacteria bacterium]